MPLGCSPLLPVDTVNPVQTLKVDEVTKEFLSGALGAEVSSFESRVCAEGQVAMTVVAHSIVYANAAAGLSSRFADVSSILPWRGDG
jgi:hypothetical protein